MKKMILVLSILMFFSFATVTNQVSGNTRDNTSQSVQRPKPAPRPKKPQRPPRPPRHREPRKPKDPPRPHAPKPHPRPPKPHAI